MELNEEGELASLFTEYAHPYLPKFHNLNCRKPALLFTVYKWMADVLTRIPLYNQDYTMNLAELLPHNWKASIRLQEIPTESGID
jgi:hypothetical protein